MVKKSLTVNQTKPAPLPQGAYSLGTSSSLLVKKPL
jgi:hypothetical protein